MGSDTYYQEDSPRWLFIFTFCAPLFALFVTGYFTLQFQVIEQDDFNTTATKLSAEFAQEVNNGIFNATDYDAIYWLMIDYEKVLINRTRPHLVGYDSNAYLTANLFLGGANYNKTGGLVVLVFYLVSFSSLTTFVIVYVMGCREEVDEEEEEIIPINWQLPHNAYADNFDRIHELKMESVKNYMNRYGHIHRAMQEKDKAVETLFPWLPSIRESVQYDFLILILACGLAGALIFLSILMFLIVVAFPETMNDRDAYHAFVAQSLGIDLVLELVYTQSWVYFILVSFQSFVFHTVCTSTALIIFKIFVD